ncbi:S1 family peptidase [Streptomyces corynorhini]|uniref:S1 family peptidase n=1 Tax=Streptomyces corynorhini TaxID=2282652 RepID=A0A370BCG0_9ACTN|nr:S1 family peptidase [Streptomyces corynorhini]RDG37386.1 S1 family peptidase [Streptomyces corynorhini]
MRISRNILAATAVGALLAVTAASGAQAAGQSADRYDPAMVEALATTLGVSEQAATARLDRQATQQDRLAALDKSGVPTDGAFFDKAGTLVVNTTGAQAERRIEEAGLTPRAAGHGQSALDRIKAELDAKALRQAPAGVTAWSVDLASDTVTVEVDNATGAAAKSFLKAARAHGDAVRVVENQQQLSTQAVVSPGDEMSFNGYVCSVGYGAQDSSGKQYLVTAGHCIEDLPVLSYKGTRFAQGTDSRFAVGSNSVDMGIAAVDSGSSLATQVGTYGSAGTVAVQGSTRAAAGADLCKSGRTTFWTCGKVNSYNVTVTYSDASGGPDTVVTGLGSSSVCTEGGDSGGAYISGNQAQGMTSGGPSAQRCSGSVNSPGSSYFQPLDDALSHYRLTLNTN